MRWSKVSVGKAPAGYGDACPVGALILVSTLLGRQNRGHAAEKVPGQRDRSGRREQRLPCLRDRLVAADVIGIGAGVDDVANRARRDLLDRRQDVGGLGRRAGIDHDHAIVADLHADVAAAAGDHEEVRAELKDLEAAGRGDARLSALRRGCDASTSLRRDTASGRPPHSQRLPHVGGWKHGR